MFQIILSIFIFLEKITPIPPQEYRVGKNIIPGG
jgi:hypothetical protein